MKNNTTKDKVKKVEVVNHTGGTLPKGIKDAIDKIVKDIESGKCPVHGVQHDNTPKPLTSKDIADYTTLMKSIKLGKKPGYIFVAEGNYNKKSELDVKGQNYVTDMSAYDIVSTISHAIGLKPRMLIDIAMEMEKSKDTFKYTDRK